MDGPGPWARDEQGELPRLLREASPGLRAVGLDSAPASGRRVGAAGPGKELSRADERARGRPVLLRGSSPASLFPLVTGLDSVSVQVAVSTHLPSRACADRRTRARTHGFSHQGVAHLRATGTHIPSVNPLPREDASAGDANRFSPPDSTLLFQSLWGTPGEALGSHRCLRVKVL